MDLVNFVNYKGCMENENNKNQENQSRITKKEDQNQYNQSGIYLRDDHCDWGSSGMDALVDQINDSN